MSGCFVLFLVVLGIEPQILVHARHMLMLFLLHHVLLFLLLRCNSQHSQLIGGEVYFGPWLQSMVSLLQRRHSIAEGQN